METLSGSEEHVMEHSYFHQLSRESEGRREALRWLAGQLRWERRLGELRSETSVGELVKQAA